MKKPSERIDPVAQKALDRIGKPDMNRADKEMNRLNKMSFENRMERDIKVKSKINLKTGAGGAAKFDIPVRGGENK